MSTGFASVYRLPASLSTSGGQLPCSFALSADTTLPPAPPSQLQQNATLSLAGTGFAAGAAAPTVHVCGARECRVLSFDSRSVTCMMPDCPATDASAVSVHVPPLGFAANEGSPVVVSGVLSASSVFGPGSAALAAGSPACGVRLTIAGGGFHPGRRRSWR